METFSASLTFARGIHRWPSQRPVTRSFDVFIDLLLNKRFSKQSIRRWFETPSRSLWRLCNVGWQFVAALAKVHYLAKWRPISLVAVTLGSPHKGPVMWKASPCHNVFMPNIHLCPRKQAGFYKSKVRCPWFVNKNHLRDPDKITPVVQTWWLSSGHWQKIYTVLSHRFYFNSL